MFRTLAPLGVRFPRTWASFEKDLNRAFDGLWTEETPRGDFVPRANLAETPTAIEVTLELPGMKAEDFTVETHDGELRISGEKKQEQVEEGKTFHRVERHYGAFRRVVALPNTVDPNKIEATYKDGLLKVTLQKADVVKPRTIPVQG